MELSPLTVMLLLTGFFHSTQTQPEDSSDRPKPTVKVTPAKHVFNGENVTLTCQIETAGSWQFDWYRNNEELVHEWLNEYIISNISESDEGDYTCKETQSTRPTYSEISAAVRLTVSERPKPTVKVTPAEHVSTGDKVTLTCQINTSGSWQYHWYRYNEKLRGDNEQKNEYTISSISESDEGDYTCNVTQSTRPTYSEISAAVRLTVSVSDSVAIGAGGFVGISVGLILVLFCTIVLIFLWYYKKNKGSGSRSPTLNPNTNQAADADHVYEPVGVKFNRKTDDSAACSSAVIPAQGLTEEHESNKATGAAAQPNDVTYSELNLNPNIKPKKKGGKTSVGADTVYSEVKHNTDKGDSETADSTYAQVMKQGNRKY